jgi:hypothetical protein
MKPSLPQLQIWTRCVIFWAVLNGVLKNKEKCVQQGQKSTKLPKWRHHIKAYNDPLIFPTFWNSHHAIIRRPFRMLSNCSSWQHFLRVLFSRNDCCETLPTSLEHWEVIMLDPEKQLFEENSRDVRFMDSRTAMVSRWSSRNIKERFWWYLPSHPIQQLSWTHQKNYSI